MLPFDFTEDRLRETSLVFFSRFLSNPEIDSFVSRLSRCYPRSATVYVARPTRSILRFAQNDSAWEETKFP
jgi:hypothetical protein